MAGSVNNLRNFVIVNDKNKIASYKNFNYLATTVSNKEFNKSADPFFQFWGNRIDLDGIEPILTIMDSNGNIANQYNFRVQNKDIDGTTNVPVYTPRPENYDDVLDTNYGSFQSPRGVNTKRKYHIADIQILVLGGYIHIFFLCDMFYVYAPNQEIQEHIIGVRGGGLEFGQIGDPFGRYDRIVVYQQHELSGDGSSFTIAPTRKTAFPLRYEPTAYDKLRYGYYTAEKVLEIDSLSRLRVAKFLYRPVGGVSDFHCGIIDSNNIYCLLGLNDSNLDLYATNITGFASDTDYLWGYNQRSDNFFQKKFSLLGTKAPPFNIYSHYVSEEKFYISYSYYDKFNIYYEKIRMKLNPSYSWKFREIINRGTGFISFIGKENISNHVNLIYNTNGNKLQRFKNDIHLGDDYKIRLNIDDKVLNWKYKLYRDRRPKTGFFKYKIRGLTDMFGKNSLPLKPFGDAFAIGVQEFYNSTLNSNINMYFSNVNNTTVRGESFYVGDNVEHSPFEKFNANINSIVSGNYYIPWLP